MTDAIRISELNKSYRVWRRSRDMLMEALLGRQRHHEFHALRDVSFNVPRGSVVGIMGQNGAGKSTLLRIVAGTLDATSGSVEVAGRISAILELGSGFHAEYSGRENVLLGGMCLGLTRAEVQGRYDEIVDFAELQDFMDQPFRTYSSGMQARLTFAVATCVDPDILIVDEALGVGDARFQLKSFDRIRQFKNRGKSILLVSHSITSIVAICDRAILLEKGRVVADGDPNDVGNLYHEMLFAPREKPDTAASAPVSLLPPDEGSSVVPHGGLEVPKPYAEAANARNADGAALPAGLDALALDILPVTERERRYGLRGIEIISTRIVDAKDRVTRSVDSLAEYKLVCRVRANKPMDDVCFGFHVRDMRGLDLFGWDMLNAGLPPLDPFVAGEERDIAIGFRANLAANHYFMSVTLAHWDGTKEDVRFDAYDLIVKPTPQLFHASLVNLDIAFEPRYVAPKADILTIPLGPFDHDSGYLWKCPISAEGVISDNPENNARSTLAVFEADRRLGPAHTDHATIRRVGKGGYSHWEGWMFLSTSDGTDPNQNGRRYVALLVK